MCLQHKSLWNRKVIVFRKFKKLMLLLENLQINWDDDFLRLT
jgi:hypothetical protein